MIYDIEPFNHLLSVELEELELHHNEFEYKTHNFIKLLEHFGGTLHHEQYDVKNGYVLIVINMNEKNQQWAKDNEDEFIEEVERIVLMMFGDQGAARYLPPVFVSDGDALMQTMEKVIPIIDDVQDKIKRGEITSEEASEQLTKAFNDAGINKSISATDIDNLTGNK